MTTLSIKLDASPARAVLAQAIAAYSDPSALLESIGDSLVESTKQRFLSTTAPDGSKWLPNKPGTIANFLREFAGSFTKKRGKLSKQGARRQAFKKPLTGKSKALQDTINAQFENGGVSIGSDLIYASTQQFGRGSIPAREFLGLSAADESEILELASLFLADPFN